MGWLLYFKNIPTGIETKRKICYNVSVSLINMERYGFEKLYAE